MTSLCIPSLGGSVIITSGVPFFFIKSLLKILFISPTKNSTFLILLIVSLFSLYVLICKLRNKPVILHVHGGAFKLFYTNSNSIQKALIRETLELSTALIVLSSYWKSFFQSIVPDCKIRVIPNSVTVQEINEFDPEKETVNILFLGALSKNKGLNELITIIPKIINYNKKVVITIAGFPIQKEKRLNFLLKALKQNSKFSGNFCFIENLIGKEKDKVFKNTDIYVLPSYFEGLPFTILESMSYGIPVITTDVGSIPDVVEPLKNGLFIKSKSEKDLLEKLIFLIDNFSLRVEIGKNNHEKIKKYYSHESIFEKVDSIYKSVIIS